MKPHLLLALLALLTTPLHAGTKPNILFIIADDASRHFGEAYGCDWVRTPNIDKLARAGLVFDNAYVVSAKCAPCRASLLTGRNSWQNEDAANHQNHFPAKFPAFGEAIRRNGSYTGSSGKVWGPGIARKIDGSGRDFGLPPFKSGKRNEPHSAFAQFLKNRPDKVPFFYWHGSKDPHRGYQSGSGKAAGKKPEDIDHVPAYWPDNATVRNDMLDYAIEVERFDAHVGQLLEALDAGGLADNTLVIVTSDHGMPFPRVKGHTFDDAHRVPLVMRWPEGITHPGRRVSELISFIDFAPSFLELHGVDVEESGMQLTGQSFTDILQNTTQKTRPFVLIGRERNDVYARPGSPGGLGYPARGIRMGNLLYVKNFEPDRWPCGNPELGLRDTDRSPTKKLIEALGPESPFWQHSFGKRPADMLFDVARDPDCVNNLASEPTFAANLQLLRETMMGELEKQGDPRALGNGAVFDSYRTVKPAPKEWEEDGHAKRLPKE